MQQLENDLDQTQEKLMNANQRLEEKEKALQNAEGEVAALNRRIQLLEEDLRGLRNAWPQPPRNSQKPPMPPTNPNVCVRCSRTGACQMKRGWRRSRINSKKPDSWLKKQTENTTRSPESWPWLRLIWSAQRREQRQANQRLSSWRKS